MVLYRTRGTVRITESKKIVRLEHFDCAIVKGDTDEQRRASFRYHLNFTDKKKRAEAKALEEAGKVDLVDIEVVCRLGLT